MLMKKFLLTGGELSPKKKAQGSLIVPCALISKNLNGKCLVFQQGS